MHRGLAPCRRLVAAVLVVTSPLAVTWLCSVRPVLSMGTRQPCKHTKESGMSMRSLMASAAGGMVLALSAGLNPLQAQGSQTEQQFVNQVAAENLMEVR